METISLSVIEDCLRKCKDLEPRIKPSPCPCCGEMIYSFYVHPDVDPEALEAVLSASRAAGGCVVCGSTKA